MWTIKGVMETSSHMILRHEFLAANGMCITGFFQIVRKPDVVIGCANVYEDAVRVLRSPNKRRTTRLSKPVRLRKDLAAVQRASQPLHIRSAPSKPHQ
jgi:hypothetical protein